MRGSPDVRLSYEWKRQNAYLMYDIIKRCRGAWSAHLELCRSGAARPTNHADSLQFHRAVERHVYQKLWVILIAPKRSSGVREAFRPWPKDGAAARWVGCIQAANLRASNQPMAKMVYMSLVINMQITCFGQI